MYNFTTVSVLCDFHLQYAVQIKFSVNNSVVCNDFELTIATNHTLNIATYSHLGSPLATEYSVVLKR